MVSEKVSTTRTGTRAEGAGGGDGRAVGARHLRGDGRHSTASAPSSAACWKAAWNAPGEGAAVSGRAPLPRQRSQNSAGAELAAVLELLVAEADGQRHHDDVVLLDELVGQVAGAVGHDVDAGHAGSLPRGQPARAGRTAASGAAGGRRRGRRGGPTGRRRGGRRRVVAAAQPDHDGAEGEPAGHDRADHPGEQPERAGRPREVRHHEHDDAHRDGGHDHAPRAAPTSRGRPGARTTGGRRPGPASAATVYAMERERARPRTPSGWTSARASTMLSPFSTR